MEFKDAIKHLRSELGLTQVELAMGLKVNAITVGRWESGKTFPPRSISALLLNYARTSGASEECLDALNKSINAATKKKLGFSAESISDVGDLSLRNLIDDASFAICLCDIETDEILYLNRKAVSLSGSDCPAIGKKCYEYLMHRDTPCEACNNSELVEDEFKNCSICRFSDGKTFNKQGKLIQLNGRKAHIEYIFEYSSSPEVMPFETELTEKRLISIFENINGGFSVRAYTNDGAVRLAYANDRYYEIFGYTREQFQEELKNPNNAVYPDDRERTAETLGKVKATRQPATFRYRVVRRDKSVIYVRCNSSVTTVDGIDGYVMISVLTDITESVRMEQQAIATGQRLDAIMKHMNSAVTVSLVKDDGTVEILFSNYLHHEMLGYTKEQYQAEVTDPFGPVHPDDLSAVRKAVSSLRNVGDEKEMLYRIITRDGRIKTIRMHITIMTFPDISEPVQLAVHADVTDIMEAQEKLSTQHEQISALLNDTPSGIAIVEVNPADIAGTLRTTYYNDRFISYSGYDREEYDELLKNNEMAFVFEEDLPILMGDTARICSGEIGMSADSLVRCHRKDGGFRWLMLTGQLSERRGDICVVNIALMDVTERQEATDRQRISDEMLRIAAETDKRAIIIYDVKNSSCRVESRTLFSAEYGQNFENIPQSLIDLGIVSQDSEDELCALFARIRDGEKDVRVSLQMHSSAEKYEWFECNAATVFDSDGIPDHAVLVFHNITEQRIKEAVFKKWQQSIDARPVDSYSMFSCNLSRDGILDEMHGNLLKVQAPTEEISFNGRAKYYSEEFVYPEDRDAYVRLLDSDLLLAMFYRGEHYAVLDYRETGEDGDFKWRRLTVETVEYTNSTDVQAFLMYEDIDEEKKYEIAERELSESDPLTGALNRSTFAARVDEIIVRNPNSHCALIMLDMDGFKQLNDAFGHAAGDQALQEVAAVLRSYARNGDLVCRLGGDEFLVWLRDVPYDAVIGKTAQQMCDHIRKAYSSEVLLSSSAGIAVYPRDGQNYDELYHNADRALYKVKQSGKGAYAFFSVVGEEQNEEITRALSAVSENVPAASASKRRMLIVDDDQTNRVLMKNIFNDEFLIDTAKNGAEAMIRLRHLGVSISVVLLDLMMPGIDGFSVLRRMQNDVNLRTIPVVIVTGDEEHSTLLKAFELGAAEYVSKPLDVDIIRMRVHSVISKAENERLRAQNSYLMLQRDEETKYRTVLESTGTVVIEYDWRNHVFIYDSEISRLLSGTYDHRGLWQVFLSDMVADNSDVKVLQDTLIELANNREEKQSSRLVKLKTPEGVKHWFRINIYKNVDDFGLAEKLIITLNDIHDEVLANDKLLFQATRDALTGLYNRAGFLDKAAEMIAAEAPGYYVMSRIDIEKFKVINDQYGTECGDRVLRHVAATVGGFIQKHNGICCRYTADKFAVLYPAELKDTDELAENHKAVSAPDCIRRPLSLRIGRCLVDDPSMPVSAIFDRAGIAEALAKDRYNTYIVDYDASMRDSILREQQIVGDMVDALQNGEFEPWFQPQYNHATGALIGAEALVRWRKNGEIVTPDDFIPVFEKNGFIYEVDQFIWRKVCELLRSWIDEGKNPPPVSVNVSRFDIFQEGFVDVLTGLVAEYRLPVDLLRLEITESAFSATTSVITDIAGKLIGAGFTVEIDDFGSGYSSLNTLKDVLASILKLDMRFFETTENSARGGNIVEAVVRMAKWLGMAVIAEGVEDRIQADYLKSIGCYYIQGYYYSKPLPVEEYEMRMQEGNAEHRLAYVETLESLDSDLFWDPRSMETLIFNSYVGGACIFEMHNGKSETLRYNDQIINELHGLVPENAKIQDVDVVPFLDETNKNELLSTLQKALDSGREASCEIRLTKGEQTEHILLTARVIAKSRESTLYYCVIQNTTEQRKLEQERAESAEQLSIIMSNLDCGVSASVFYDEHNIGIFFANNGFYELFGYTEEQFKTEVPNPIEPILPEDREKTLAVVARIVRERGSDTYEYRCRRRDGNIIRVQTTNTIVSLAGMGDTVLLAVTTDITALRNAEEQNLKTADRLSAVMNAMTSGMTAVTFSGKRMDFLFANDRFYQLHGVERENCQWEGFFGAMRLIHPDDRKRVGSMAMQTTEVGKSNAIEYRVNYQDGTLHWIKALITVTKLIGLDKPVQVSIYTDITDEKKSREQLRFLNESAGEILAQPDSEKAINDTLKKLLAYFAGERSYIFELNDEVQTSDNTYEVCAPGITAEIERLQGVPYDTQECWFEAFHKDGFVGIPDVAAIDESEAAMREILTVQNIRSIIVAPLWRDGKLIGYLGVDNPSVAVDQVSQLIALSDYIAVLLTRRDLMKTIEHERQMAKQLVDDTPGGFIRMELFADRSPTIVTVNEGLCKMLGMTKEEVLKEYGDNVYACLAPEDADTAPGDIAQAYTSGGQYTSTCRLRKKDGSLFWVMLFGRFLHGSAGKLYLNAYFTDVSEHRSAEQLQVELLDNLPFGAAMYSYDGKSIKALHINKQYIVQVNREVNTASKGFNPVEFIHPDDRKRVFDEIDAAISKGENRVCDDIRLLYGKDEFRCFHLDASIVPSGDGKYILYVAYSPVTDREQELKTTTERLKLLSDSIPGGIATFRCMPGSIEPIYFNDGICTLAGYSRGEFDNGTVSVLGLIFDEDKPVIREQIELLMRGRTSLDYYVRIHTKTGGYKWVQCIASVTGKESEEAFIVSAVLTDVTGQQEERERLRVSEELSRLAIDQSGKTIARYDVATLTLTLPYKLPDLFDIPRVLENVPEEQIRLGRISPDTADAYRSAFERIKKGEASGEATYQQNSTLGWRWLKSRFTTVFADDGRPVSAVVTFEDITEQRDKEAIYARWQNAMSERAEDSYTIVRCNLNQSSILDSWNGKLLEVQFTDPAQSFNSRTTEYANRFVYADDRAAFRAFLNSDTMLAEYHRGHRSDSIDFRELNSDGNIRWLRLTVDLVEYTDSTDVEAYLLFENIDEQKHAELSAIRRAESDPLTGILNRTAFAQRVNQVICRFGLQTNHAFFMMDIDGFKQVNDAFGHGAGDQVLTDIADTLTHLCRKDDIVGRLGGDEFFMFLSNITSEDAVTKKAQQICDMTRKSLGVDVHISASIGIALHPQDGDSFETLYKIADEALYRAKNAGKDGYAFSSGDPVISAGAKWRGNSSADNQKHDARRILIVDDNKIAQNALEVVLKNEYYIEKASDGPSALAMLHHYGTAISVVLLDLMMPGMDGFEVLDRIQKDERVCMIPVIVVSSDEDRETALHVIRAGAFDIITKPVDADLLRVRVESAVRKSENERLRVQNSYLDMRNTEVNSYRAALERTGTMVVMLDSDSQKFSYSPTVSQMLSGRYDERPLWSILLSDKVADRQTVQEIQQLAQDVLRDEERTEGSLKVRLKTKSGVISTFELNVFKEPEDHGFASKLILTLRENVPPQEDA